MVVAGGLSCMRLGVSRQGREEAATVATGLWGFAWPGCYETQVNSQHDDFNEGHSQSRPVDSRGWGFSGRILLPTALVFFIAGSLFTAQFMHLREVESGWQSRLRALGSITPYLARGLPSNRSSRTPRCRLNTI